jgi:hypothetical protein
VAQVYRPAAGVLGQHHPGHVSRGRQRVQGAAALVTWGGAFHLHEWAAHYEQVSADAEKLQAAKAELEQLEREGIVQRSTSPWASPLHIYISSSPPPFAGRLSQRQPSSAGDPGGGRLHRPRRPSGSVPAHTAGGFFYITADSEASGRRRGTPLRRLQRGGEAAGTAGGQARRVGCLP